MRPRTRLGLDHANELISVSTTATASVTITATTISPALSSHPIRSPRPKCTHASPNAKKILSEFRAPTAAGKVEWSHPCFSSIPPPPTPIAPIRSQSRTHFYPRPHPVPSPSPSPNHQPFHCRHSVRVWLCSSQLAPITSGQSGAPNPRSRCHALSVSPAYSGVSRRRRCHGRHRHCRGCSCSGISPRVYQKPRYVHPAAVATRPTGGIIVGGGSGADASSGGGGSGGGDSDRDGRSSGASVSSGGERGGAPALRGITRPALLLTRQLKRCVGSGIPVAGVVKRGAPSGVRCGGRR